MTGAKYCCVCNKVFSYDIKRHYVSSDNIEVGIASTFKSQMQPMLHDTFDCPFCGCQNIIQDRLRKVDL